MYRIGVVCTVIDIGAAALPQGPINTIYPDFVVLDILILLLKYIGFTHDDNHRGTEARSTFLISVSLRLRGDFFQNLAIFEIFIHEASS